MKYPLNLLLLILCSYSCARLNYLDQAQNAFNQGASLETNLSFGNPTDLQQPYSAGNQTMSWATPDLCYHMAYAYVNKALSKESQLKADGVLANAYALRALSGWKLGLHTQATESALAAKIALQDSEVPLPREAALMTALEGLILADQAYAGVQQLKAEQQNRATTPNTTEALNLMANIRQQYERDIINSGGNGKIEKALTILDNAKKEVPGRPELQNYFVMCQLAALKTWLDELDQINSLLKRFGFASNNNNELKRWFDQEDGRYSQKRDLYLGQLANLLPEQKNHALYKRWELWLFN